MPAGGGAWHSFLIRECSGPGHADLQMSLIEQGGRGLARGGRVRAGTCLPVCVLNTHVYDFLRSPGDMVGGGCPQGQRTPAVRDCGYKCQEGRLRCVVEWNRMAHSENWQAEDPLDPGELKPAPTGTGIYKLPPVRIRQAGSPSRPREDCSVPAPAGDLCPLP